MERFQNIFGHQIAEQIFTAKERTWPLAPAIRMLWETAEKTWGRSFAVIVAVKRCGRFMRKIGFIVKKQREGEK